jgi:hypothetical protein
LFSYLFCSRNLERWSLNGGGVFNCVRLEALVTDGVKLPRLRIHLVEDVFAAGVDGLTRSCASARHIENEQDDSYAHQSARQALH